MSPSLVQIHVAKASQADRLRRSRRFSLPVVRELPQESPQTGGSGF